MHALNAFAPIEVSACVPLNETSASSAQPENALSPTVATPAGIFMDFNLEQPLNAFAPIAASTLSSPNVALTSAVQAANALAPIAVAVSAIIMSVILTHPPNELSASAGELVKVTFLRLWGIFAAFTG